MELDFDKSQYNIEYLFQNLKDIHGLIKPRMLQQTLSLQKIVLRLENDSKMRQLDQEMNKIHDSELSQSFKQLQSKIELLESSNQKLKSQNESLKRLHEKPTKQSSNDISCQSSSSCETIGENEGQIQLSKSTSYRPKIKVIPQSITMFMSSRYHYNSIKVSLRSEYV